MTRIWFSVIILLSLLNCVAVIDNENNPPYDRSISEPEALDIAEATFRYQFQNNASGSKQKQKAYFLTLFEKDPTEDFLNRFQGNIPTVKKGSEFEVGNGLKFNVHWIKRINKTKVKVSGGYYEGFVSSSGNTYYLKKKNGEWIVTKDIMHWIS